MDASVIVVNWNTKELLRDCLRSVYEQTRRIEFEVIVTDNASTDGSVEMLKSEFPQVTIIPNSTNRGFAAGNNQAMGIARGRYVLLLNSDTVVLDNAIGKTVKYADSRPDSAVIGCRILNKDRTLQESCFRFPSVLNLMLSSSYLYKIFPKSKFFGRERMTWWPRDTERQVDVVTGCYMLIRRSAIEQIGLMDEDYFMYAEETDWCYRFKKAGWKLEFTPEAEIIHLGGASSSQIKPAMALQQRASILLFFKKNRSYPEYLTACGLTAVWCFIRIPFWFTRGMLSKRTRKPDWQIVKTYSSGAIKALQGWQALKFEK